MNETTGIDACNDALQRLLNDSSHDPRYVGVEHSDITPAMVSVEAGYDKGYLKRSRPTHKALIARIESLRCDGAEKSDNKKIELKKALKRVEKYREEARQAKKIMDKVLTQNLILLQKVKELESKLANPNTVIKF